MSGDHKVFFVYGGSLGTLKLYNKVQVQNAYGESITLITPPGTQWKQKFYSYSLWGGINNALRKLFSLQIVSSKFVDSMQVELTQNIINRLNRKDLEAKLATAESYFHNHFKDMSERNREVTMERINTLREALKCIIP
jgi:Tfp pilus assembly major pilin PilA